ncbi:hypothetical protein PTKIN_Ptkin10aG0029300 [Pterospermum kingtungense]
MAELNKHVPQDITGRTLPLLPVKSLLRFKSVCKSWSSLITSPAFTRNHFDRALMSRIPKTIDLKLLLSRPCGFKSFDFEKFSDEIRPFKTFRPPFGQNKFCRILGSCHGLICLLMGGNDSMCLFFLWNPSTGESNKLPACINFPVLYEFDYFDFYGFGYDSSSDDYKLVISICRKALIFSLAENSWRLVDEAETARPFRPILFDPYNRALHWQFNGGEYMLLI